MHSWIRFLFICCFYAHFNIIKYLHAGNIFNYRSLENTSTRLPSLERNHQVSHIKGPKSLAELKPTTLHLSLSDFWSATLSTGPRGWTAEYILETDIKTINELNKYICMSCWSIVSPFLYLTHTLFCCLPYCSLTNIQSSVRSQTVLAFYLTWHFIWHGEYHFRLSYKRF